MDSYLELGCGRSYTDPPSVAVALDLDNVSAKSERITLTWAGDETREIHHF